MAQKTEKSIVEAAQNGCLDSFASLYRRHYSAMVALAYSVLADIHLAEDAAQQAFVIACRDLPKLKSKDKFAAWLAGICRNVARQMQRSGIKLSEVKNRLAPESENNRDDCGEVVRRAVWQLRAVDKEAIVLRYYDGLSYAQISEVLGVSQEAVHGRLTRAKRKIADYLKRTGFQE